MRKLAEVIVRSGIISESQRTEFMRWSGMEQSINVSPPSDATMFIQQIELAMQEEEMILLRETDLEALQLFLHYQKKGSLHLGVAGEDGEPIIVNAVDVSYAVRKTGEYIIPWTSESMEELLVNGFTYFLNADGAKVYFRDVRELFYGDVKAFMVCVPTITVLPTIATLPEESNGEQSTDHSPNNGA